MDQPTLIGTGFVVLAGFVWLFCAYLAYQTAPKFKRRPVTWLILGLIFGPFALFALYLASQAEEPVMYYCGIGLFAASVLFNFYQIKQVYDEQGRH